MGEQKNLFDELGNLEELKGAAAGELQAPARKPKPDGVALGGDALQALTDSTADCQRYEKFKTFHAENPLVYVQLVKFARQATAAGKTKIGMAMLYERLRWQSWIETVDDTGEWNLNNNWRAYYARLIMAQEDDLAGIFELRKLKHERGGECENSN